jgi:hypothetical protein
MNTLSYNEYPYAPAPKKEMALSIQGFSHARIDN